MQISNDAKRRGLLAKIHIAKKQMGLTDSEYRLILAVTTDAESCKDLTVEELETVLDRLKSLGFKEAPRKDDPKRMLSRQKSLIRWHWKALSSHGAVTDGGDKALDAWIKKRFGVDKLQWLTVAQAQTAIESLKKWQKRVGCGGLEDE